MGSGETGGIHGQEHVGGAVGAFIPDPLQQFVFLAFDAVDLDAGLLGEVGVQGLIRLIVAGRVEIEDFFLGLGADGGAGEEGGQQCGLRLHQGLRGIVDGLPGRF